MLAGEDERLDERLETIREGDVSDDETKPVIVVIDDEPQIRRLLRVTLEGNGYKVYEAATGQLGLVEVAGRHPEVVLLDLGLPDIEGIDVLLQLREWTSVPVIVLSVRETENDKVTLLKSGADDYLTKPFSSAELLARIQVARRHYQADAEDSVFRTGPLEVNLSSRVVKVAGKPVKLSGTEYALLRLFVKHAGRVLTHPQIMTAVWGPNHTEKTHYLHVYMAYLREKIEADPANPELLITEVRVGYRLCVKPPIPPAPADA